jgi:hypothetical protein
MLFPQLCHIYRGGMCCICHPSEIFIVTISIIPRPSPTFHGGAFVASLAHMPDETWPPGRSPINVEVVAASEPSDSIWRALKNLLNVTGLALAATTRSKLSSGGMTAVGGCGKIRADLEGNPVASKAPSKAGGPEGEGVVKTDEEVRAESKQAAGEEKEWETVEVEHGA